MTDRLSHLDSEGRARMVDVSAKPETIRTARAAGSVHMHRDTLALAIQGDAKKGDVRAVAELAGVMAAKRTMSGRISGLPLRFRISEPEPAVVTR